MISGAQGIGGFRPAAPYPDAPRLDDMVRRALSRWPQRPPGTVRTQKQPGTWLRGRPHASGLFPQPFLKLPGSARLRTLPDGLWLHFGPDPAERYVDILGLM